MNDTVSKMSLSTLRSSNAVRRLSVVVLRSLFFIWALTEAHVRSLGMQHRDLLRALKQQEKLVFYSLRTLQSELTEPFRHKTYLTLNLWNVSAKVFACSRSLSWSSTWNSANTMNTLLSHPCMHLSCLSVKSWVDLDLWRCMRIVVHFYFGMNNITIQFRGCFNR